MRSGGKYDGESTTTNSTSASPAIVPSGFPVYRSYMTLWFVWFTVLYIGTIRFFEEIQEFLMLPPSSPEYCQDAPGSVCWRADLFAFEVVSGAALTWAGILGIWAWHIKRVDRLIPATPEGRLFGYIPMAHQLTALGTTFQLFDLFVSLLIPEQRQPLMLAHHTMATTVSWYGLNNQYFHYYGIFYLGCSEISTIPLIFIDLARFFPPEAGTSFDTFVNGICGPVFAVTFTVYRVILWWTVGYQMFSDIMTVLGNGAAKKMRPGRNHVLYVMMTLNILLGLLQLYWFQIILVEAGKVLGFTTVEGGKQDL